MATINGVSESKDRMSKRKHTETQILAVVRELEAGRLAAEVAREQGVSKHTVYAWRAKYRSVDAKAVQRAKELEEENGRLRKLVADLSLEKDMLKQRFERAAGQS